METVTVSSKYQVVIPRAIRQSLGIRSGQKLMVVNDNGHLVLVPVRPMREMRGFLKGIDTTVKRDPDRV